MAACTPFGRLYTDHILHVLNAFPVPLVIERREMMHGARPLLVNVVMAALTGVRFHKILAWDRALMRCLGRAGKKRALGAISFSVHGERRGRIRDSVRTKPAVLPALPTTEA